MTVNMSKTQPAYVLLAEARALREQLDVVKGLYDEKLQELAKAVKHETGKHETVIGSFTVRENNTYNEAAIVAALKPGQVRRVSTMKLDKAAVKALYPKVYAEAKRTNGVSVIIG